EPFLNAASIRDEGKHARLPSTGFGYSRYEKATGARPRGPCRGACAGLPAALLAAVLLVEPFLERGEVFDKRLAADLAAAGEGLERVGPRLARAHLEHRVQLLADRFVAVEAAAVQRPGPAGLVAGRLVELELQDPREEVAHVGDARGNVIL